MCIVFRTTILVNFAMLSKFIVVTLTIYICLIFYDCDNKPLCYCNQNLSLEESKYILMARSTNCFVDIQITRPVVTSLCSCHDHSTSQVKLRSCSDPPFARAERSLFVGSRSVCKFAAISAIDIGFILQILMNSTM